MTKYHAFRIDTEDGYAIFVNEDQEVVDAKFAEWWPIVRDTAAAYALGTVEAIDKTNALTEVHEGYWEYSELP